MPFDIMESGWYKQVEKEESDFYVPVESQFLF